MENIEQHIEKLKVKEHELEILSEMLGQEGLVQCIRLLSSYIAIYKKEFGDLSMESYESVLDPTKLGDDMMGVFNTGMDEAISMMTMTVNAYRQQAKEKLKVTIN